MGRHLQSHLPPSASATLAKCIAALLAVAAVHVLVRHRTDGSNETLSSESVHVPSSDEYERMQFNRIPVKDDATRRATGRGGVISVDGRESLATLSRQLNGPSEKLSDGKLRRCTSLLEGSASLKPPGASHPLLTQDDYIRFVDAYSEGTVRYQSFADLPLSLIVLFYSGACTDGNRCEDDNAIVAIDLGSLPTGLQHRICQTIDGLLIGTQVEYKSQYQLWHTQDVLADDILHRRHGNTVVNTLLETTKVALFDRLGCSSLASATAKSLTSGGRRQLGSLRAFLRLLGQQDHERMLPEILECPYQIDVEITRFSDIVCLKDGQVLSHMKCALVTTNVAVTALTSETDLTEPELYRTVDETLRDSFSGV